MSAIISQDSPECQPYNKRVKKSSTSIQGTIIYLRVLLKALVEAWVADEVLRSLADVDKILVVVVLGPLVLFFLYGIVLVVGAVVDAKAGDLLIGTDLVVVCEDLQVFCLLQLLDLAQELTAVLLVLGEQTVDCIFRLGQA